MLSCKQSSAFKKEDLTYVFFADVSVDDMEVESYDGEVEMLESYDSGLAALTSSADFTMEVQQAVTQHLAIMPNPGNILGFC